MSEKEHFKECCQRITDYIKDCQERVRKGKETAEELFLAVQQGDGEMYDQLMVSLSIQEQNENELRKNQAALLKPYFGRVDYAELSSENPKTECLYIGKHGVTLGKTEILVVDWRAPVSSLYYENSLGQGSYDVPDCGLIDVDLKLKRTFDIENQTLLGYYDSDVASNDELLIKYLAKNKDVVLGDIIATIQKEQNEIIREKPFANMIVQGVAGSGKTTVAMHRISYLLFNYAKWFGPEEICIIGSNDMLLSYITSGLPELDVHNVGQMRMDSFLIHLLGKEWKKKYQLCQVEPEAVQKSRLPYIQELDRYLSSWKNKAIQKKSIKDPHMGMLLTKESIETLLDDNKDASVQQLYQLLNGRIKKRLRFLIPADKKALYQVKTKQYQNYYTWTTQKRSCLELYLGYLSKYMEKYQVPWESMIARIQSGNLDIYDIACLTLIQKRITEKKTVDQYSQIFIDEAQDFGEMIYYVLRMAIPKCCFTIMGDVSQNINYATGMNQWEDLVEQVFQDEKSEFHILSKSYRNTIEISDYAGRVLERASSGRYRIEPVIRHGMDVQFYQEKEEELAAKAADIIQGIRERNYDTTAVICRNEEEAEEVRIQLSKYLQLDEEDQGFQKGIMVLPIQLTKGLEFDTVLIWNPGQNRYENKEGDAKLLYVAITRALHELHVIYDNSLSEVLRA